MIAQAHRLAAVFLVAWLLSGTPVCPGPVPAAGSTEPRDDPPQGEIRQLEDLQGTSWRLVSMEGKPVPPEAGLTLSFEGARASGNAGCNNFRGEVSSEGGQRIAFGPLARTEKACLGPGIMERERAFLGALSGTFQFRYRGGHLILSHRSGEGPGGTLHFAPRR